MTQINERCPMKFECGQKKCEYHYHERDCGYYRANSRPDMEIEDQEQAIQAEWDAKMNPPSVLADSPATEEGQESALSPVNGLMMYLPVSHLHPHPDNPRKDLGDLTELADSIRANGIFQNLTVIPIDDTYESFTVVIGHRRLAAAKLAGLAEVPCVIAHMTYKEQLQTMLLENMQRSELTVYEQAQGFQMMLDLGDTVEEVAEKSGFSVTTVRRRVKMMELDQAIMRNVSSRQLSLTDFDKLAQIEDISARNECLSKIGTRDFDISVGGKLRKQAIQKKMPLVMELLNAAGAKRIPDNERYSSKYNPIGSVFISDWKEGTPLIPEKVTGQLFYYIEDYSGSVNFREKAKRAEPVRRSAAEIEREKQIAEAWSQLDEKAAVAYELRSAFVKGLSYGKRNAELLLRGALIAGVISSFSYLRGDNNCVAKILGMETNVYSWEHAIEALSRFSGADEKHIPMMVYAMFDDSAKLGYSDSYRKAYPKHRITGALKGVYMWLTSLGYEMSEEERQLLDGTHELFRPKEENA